MTFRKSLVCLLAVCMCLGLLPFGVFADANVAEIGGVMYESLAAAVAAAQDGDEITMLADDNVSLTSGGEIVIDKSLTIYGENCTIYGTNNQTGTNDIFITGSGDVAIYDLNIEGFGCDAATDPSHAPVYVSSNFTGNVELNGLTISEFNRGGIFLYGGTFNVENCIIDCANDTAGAFTKGIEIKGSATGTIVDTMICNMERSTTSWATAAIEIYGSGSITVEGCMIYSDTGDHSSVKATYGIVSNRVGEHDPSGGTTHIIGTTIDVTNAALSVSDSDAYGPVNDYTFIVDDSEFTNYIGTWSAASTITINSGEFAEDVYADEGSIIIHGGNFTNFAPTTGSAGSIVIDGGTFDAPVPAEYCAEDYAPVDLGNGEYGVASAYVAQIGNAKYETLEDAIAAAQAGDTITLLADVTVNTGAASNSRLAISKSMTIDGDGHTISINNRGFGVGMNASAPIDVTFENVTITNASAYGRCIDTRGNINSLTLDGVNLITTHNSNVQPLTIGGNQATAADVTITDSTIQTSEDGSTGYAIITFNPVNMTIENSTVKGWACIYAKGPDGSAGSAGSVFDITDSTLVSKNIYSGETNAFSMFVAEDDNVTINVTDSEINVSSTGDQHQAIASTQANSGLDDFAVNLGEGNEVTLTGNGVFTDNDADLNVSGGSFNVEVPESFCADGYIPEDNGDGSYGVKVGSYVAQIGNAKYESLADAIAAVPTDGTETTITMLDDSVETGVITVAAGKNIVLDLNGKTVSYTTATSNASVYFITNNGTLEIVDSGDDGVITLNNTSANYSYESVTVYNLGGTLTLTDGKIENLGGGLSYAVNNSSNAWGSSVISTFNMDGGVISAPSGDAALRVYQNCAANSVVSGNTVSITGGTILDTGIFVDTYIYQPTAQYTGDNITVDIDISGGTINGLIDMKLRHPFNTSLNITDGDFTNSKLWVRKHSEWSSVVAEPTAPMVTISGGEFDFVEGKAFGLAYDCGATSWTTYTEPYDVSGGIFDTPVPAEFCAEGYVPDDLGSGKYSVKACYTITVADTGAQVTAPETASEGETVTFSISRPMSPFANYELELTVVTDGGDSVTVSPAQQNNSYTFTMPADNVTISATWIAYYNVNLQYYSNGFEFSADKESARAGETVTVTVEAVPEGLILNGINAYKMPTSYVMGEEPEYLTVTKVDDTHYTFVMPEAGVVVEADLFRPGDYTITDATGLGSREIWISVDNMQVTCANEGDVVTVAVMTFSDMTPVLTVTTDGGDTVALTEMNMAQDGYEFTMPADNVTITVDFIPSIGFTWPIDGEVKAFVGDTQVRAAEPGTLVTLKAFPDDGYALASISAADTDDDPVALTKVNSSEYTFIMPEKSVIVSATFGEAYTVTFDIDGDTTDVTVASGSTVDAPDVPEKFGYEFAGWYLGDDLFDIETPITSDITLTARWTQTISLSTDSVEIHINDVASITVNNFPAGSYIRWEYSSSDILGSGGWNSTTGEGKPYGKVPGVGTATLIFYADSAKTEELGRYVCQVTVKDVSAVVNGVEYTVADFDNAVAAAKNNNQILEVYTSNGRVTLAEGETLMVKAADNRGKGKVTVSAPAATAESMYAIVKTTANGVTTYECVDNGAPNVEITDANNNVTYSATLDFKAGGTTKLLRSFESGRVNPSVANAVLDLNGQTVTFNNSDYALYIRHLSRAVSLTITDSVGGGKIINNGGVAIWAADSDSVTIEAGEFVGVGTAVYTTSGGTATINGGTFKVVGEDASFLINCQDSNKNTITVNGGTFYGFDPANNSADGEGTNYLSDGRISFGDNNVYTVGLCRVFMGAAADSSKTRADLYFVIPEGADPYDFTVKVNGDDAVCLGDMTPDANGYKFSISVPAKNMGDAIDYTLKYNGDTVLSGEVSIAMYANNLKTYYPQYTDFVNAMLAYGAAAQEFFGYNTEELVGEIGSPAKVNADRFDAAGAKAQMNADPTIPIVYSAMNVTFLADTTFSVAFRLKNDYAWEDGLDWVRSNLLINGDSIDAVNDEIGYANLDGEITATVVENELGYRYVIVSKKNVSLDTLTDSVFTFQVNNNSFDLSVMNYLAAAEAGQSSTLINLARTLYAYAEAAAALNP